MLAIVKEFIADLARPFALYAMGFSSAWATVVIARKVEGGGDGALVLGAIGVTLVGIYAGKAIEETRKSGHNAEVEKVRAAQSSPPPAQALAPADGGELPPDQRVKL
jgi:hypothetical protein